MKRTKEFYAETVEWIKFLEDSFLEHEAFDNINYRVQSYLLKQLEILKKKNTPNEN